MDKPALMTVLNEFTVTAKAWIVANVLTYGFLIQGALIIGAWLISFLLLRSFKKRLPTAIESDHLFRKFINLLLLHVTSLSWLALQLIALLIAYQLQWPYHLLKVTTNLLTVWVVIDFTSSLFKSTGWVRFIAFSAWTLAALNILDLLLPTIELFDALAISFGDVRISLLTVIKGIFALIFLLWIAQAITQIAESRIKTSPTLSPSLQVLFIKLIKVILITIAILAALSAVGLDLTSFTVFTGAIGVGIGFGLQKIISNLISGIILLLDKSIKPGDVITIGDTYGWINSLGARYVSLITRDGKEFLIPNEDLITHQVENWSFSNNTVRLKIPIGIHYKSDVRKAIALCLEAVAESERILKNPPPICLLVGFGDSSVDLELRLWIEDPRNGLGNVRSEVLLKVWDKFHQHDIEIPYPQRDLHIRSPQPIDIATATPPEKSL